MGSLKAVVPLASLATSACKLQLDETLFTVRPGAVGEVAGTWRPEERPAAGGDTGGGGGGSMTCMRAG